MSTISTPDRYIQKVTVRGADNFGPVFPSITTFAWTNLRIAQTGPSNWRYLIRNNMDATTELYGIKYSVQVGKGYWYAFQKADPSKGAEAVGDVIGGFLSISNPTGAANAEAVRRAQMKFNRKVISAVQSFQAGVSMGEFLEAVRFVKNPLKSLTNESWRFVGRMGRLKKVYRRNPRDYLGAMNDTYLGYRYAALPLANEISDALLSLDNIKNGRREKLKFTASGEYNVQRSATRQPSYGLVPGVYNPVLFYTDDVEWTTVTFRGGMLPTPMGTVPPISELGLTLSDTFLTAWNLIPFSFVVDYIANVSEILESMKVCSVDFTYLNRTVRNGRTVRVLDLLQPPAQSGYQPFIAYGGSASLTATNVHRQRVTSTDLIPNLRFNLPGNWQKINTLSLALSFIHTNPHAAPRRRR